jgi:5-hydroxyisourate hydrolase-like protein (transthyretin family)
MTPIRILLSLSALLALLLATVATLVAGTPTAQAATAEQGTEAAYRINLPLVIRSPGFLYGRVTENGQAASGVTVSLRFYNGASWSTAATTTTDSTGRYQFTNPAGLSGSQRYQVTFDNAAGNDNRLAWWGTRHLTSYPAGDSTHIGDFDIAAVHLGEPAHQATLALPATFRWQRRGASGNDSYAVRLYDPADLNPLYVAPYVGYSDNFTLNNPPGGFAYGTAYTWDVILIAPDGATGVSRGARSVRFSNGGIFGQVTQTGGAAPGVPLQLRYFNGNAWATLATTTTGSDGRYAFTNLPSLGAGQKYYVRYENVTQTAGRLFVWSTRSLTAYTSGTAVELGSFDIADVALVGPPGGANIDPPVLFQWTRRSATPGDSYILEIYDPSDFQPRWLSPLLGYAESYTVFGMPPGLSLNTPYAWDVIVVSPDGGSGVSRVARLVQFASHTVDMRIDSAPWPFDEELPPRDEVEGGE